MKLDKKGEMSFYNSREEFQRGEKCVSRIALSEVYELSTYPKREFGFRLEGPHEIYYNLASSDAKSMKRWWNAISRIVSRPPRHRSPVNQRDLSTVVTGIRKGVLFRSSMQYNLGKIRTVLDLRRPEMSKPKRSAYLNVDTEFIRINLVPSSVGAKLFRALPLYTSIPALFSSNRVNTFRDAVLRHVGLRQLYIMILKQKRSICLAMRAVANACKKKRVPILIHCIHGKDRTGLVVALTLLICDVSEEEVCKDYAASGPLLIRAKHSKMFGKDSPMWLEDDKFVVTPIVVMQSVLSWMKSKTSTKTANEAAETYLRNIGLSRESIDVIRETFKDDPRSISPGTSKY